MKKILFVAMTSLCTMMAGAQMHINMGEGSPLRKLQIAEIATTNLYVDSVDENKLVEDAIRGMLEKLDPHSSYSTPKEVKTMNEPLQGNFEGIGVQFNMVDDTLMVIQPVTNGPSEKVGIIAGDRIVSVNDTAIAGVKMSKEEIMKRLRGPKGTKVVLGVVRSGIKDRLTFTVVRDKIPVKSVDAAYMIRPGIGYIRIGNFGATTHQEFCDALKTLQQQGAKDLMLDLQENGGGYLQAAVNIANEMLQEGDLIVYTEGRRVPRQDYRADGKGMFRDGKIVVLVDEYTASAAEIVSGAIQDQDRGLVVGRRSFGKGLVQRPIDLPDGSMIRLTIAHYYTPAGRCIQKPYEKGKQKDYAMDVVNRLKHGELTNQDSIHFADSLRFETLRKHRAVYGGGGIMPDYFVPLDTMRYTKFHRELAAKGIIIQQNLRYIDKNRKQLKKQYADFQLFKQQFQVPSSLIDAVMAEAEKQNVKPKDDGERQRTLPQLSLQLKALIARDLWDMSEYYSIINEENDAVKRALEVMTAGSLFTLQSGDAVMTVDIEKGGKILSLKHKDQEIISQSRFPESFGSTFWTSPQKEWNWPPVQEFDKQPYTVQRRDTHLVISSPVSKRLGMSVGKDFSVDSKDGAFVIAYSIKNEGSAARRVAPWEITRVANGDGTIFFEPVDSIWPAGLMNFERSQGAAYYKTDEAPRNRKVNADGRGWLAYSADGLLLVKTFQDLKSEEPAPGEAEIQVYVNRGKTYIELESQGAYTLLEPGEELHWTVRWYLTPCDKETAETLKQLLKTYSPKK